MTNCSFFHRKVDSNSISYLQFIIPIMVDGSTVKYLPLLSSSLTQLGVKNKPIDQFDSDIKLYTGGISLSPFIQNNIHGSTELKLICKSNCLEKNTSKMIELIQESFNYCNFDDLVKMQSLLSSTRASAINSIADSGHLYAMMHSASNLSLSSKLHEEMEGISQALHLNAICKESIESMAEKLKQLFYSIMMVKPVVSVVSEAIESEKIQHFINNLPLRDGPKGSLSASSDSAVRNVFFAMPFSTNYAAKSFKTVTFTHKDSAALRVLSKLLSSKYLLREIREKNGAYGGGARYSAMDGIFSFYSYRDPNPASSLSSFTNSLLWAIKKEFSDQVYRFLMKGFDGVQIVYFW